jgi:histidine triad (HIT) family protein
MHMPTLFERIIGGQIPAQFVYRDEQVVAFRDIHPRAPTHILIVPIKPIATVDDVSAQDEGLLGHLFVVAAQIARSEGIAASGYRLIVNCREHGGQEVYHLHLHLLGGKPLGPMVSG